MKKRPQLLVFDVNETLLDLQPLKKRINSLLDSPKAFEDWFSKLIQFAMVETLTGNYSDFGDIGTATLRITAEKHSKLISEEDIKSSLDIIKKLKPHPEVKEALKKLKSEGFRLVALTNGGLKTLEEQMKYSGLDSLFDALYSVELVEKFKPHPDTYQFVLNHEQTEAKNAMLIAAHAWDIAGAQNSGLQTAFISRPGKFLYPINKEPDFICNDFEELFQKLTHWN